jgi:hypothetical protein
MSKTTRTKKSGAVAQKPIITSAIATTLANKVGLDLNKFPLKLWEFGIGIELEHGKRSNLTNVTNDDLLVTAKIALAHIIEFPDYYQRLAILEQDAEKYWKKNSKPDILISKK